jgi:hypothetical protein
MGYFKKYGDSSGGTLNDICEAFRLATRKNSISVISLQQKHKILSAEYLLDEIDRHFHEDCKCGLKSAATIEMLAKNLFNTQDKMSAKAILTEKGEEKWDYDTCLHWMRNLMGKNSFKGKRMEDEAIKALKKEIWKFKIAKADEETDVSHMVDLIMTQNNEVKAGIQVKPDSFYHMNLSYVKKLHGELDYPVYDLIYDSQGKWTNYLSVISNFL